MKALDVLFALACPLHAALLATVETTQGPVVIELQYDKAPQAVANFITLAEATRSRIHPVTGAGIRSPLYIGEKFFRVVNDPNFKIIQTGSGTGTNSGGPGFSFKDEFDPTLTHVPYVLSMANSGPNTNGSQIFFTGSVSTPNLNNVHTVFGLITDPASRSVIDAILAAGSNTSTITGLTFSRTDAAAIAFNEHAQNLPVVAQAKGNLVVTPNVSATWNLNEYQDTGDIFRAFRSNTLAANSWTELTSAKRQSGIVADGFVAIIGPVTLDAASAPAAFYNLTWVTHPGSVTPTRLTSRTVEMKFGVQTLTYVFDSSGGSGTGTFKLNAESSESFPFVLTSLAATGHAFNFSCYNLSGSVAGPYSFRVGCDTATSTLITGRHSSGIATITR
ncbi:MAG: peptidylprolyl isomerase [Verrucomicrobiota bacterium]